MFKAGSTHLLGDGFALFECVKSGRNWYSAWRYTERGNVRIGDAVMSLTAAKKAVRSDAN